MLQDGDAAYPGSLAAIGFEDGRIAVVNTLSGGTLFSMSSERPIVYRSKNNNNNNNNSANNHYSIDDVVFTLDNRAVIGRSGTSVTIWVLPEGKERRRIPSQEATSMAHCGRHPEGNGDFILIGNARGYVSMWHVPLSLTNHTEDIHEQAMDVALISESYQGENIAITCTACSLDGSRCLSGNASGTLVLWSSVSGSLEKHAVLKTQWGLGAPVTSCCFRPDGQRVAACSSECPTVHVWDVHGAPSSVIWSGCGTGKGQGVESVKWSGDGRAIVTLSSSGTGVWIWDSESGSRLALMEGSHQSVRCLGFVYIPIGPDTVMCSMFTGGNDRILRFWNFSGIVPGAPGRRIFEKEDLDSVGRKVHSHGRIINKFDVIRAAQQQGEKDNTVGAVTLENAAKARLEELRAESAKRRSTALSGHEGGSVTCSSKCGPNMIVTGGVDGILRIWALPEGKHIASLSGTGGGIGVVRHLLCFVVG